LDTYMNHRVSESTLRNVFNAQQYTDAVLGLLTRRRVPFSAVEWDEMKSLALACNPAIEDCLITNRRRAHKIINANYALYIDQLKGLLQHSVSMIHISTDLWTSPHRHAMLAVCAQWVDKDYRLRKALLGLPECRHSHNGETQAALIAGQLHNFNIKNVGYYTGDNATSNDTCLEALSIRLKEELDIEFDPKLRRVRCIGHIINLSLQSFLLARSKEALTAALDAADDAQDEVAFERFSASLADTEAQPEESSKRGRKTKSTAKASQSSVNMADYAGWEGIPALQKLHSLAIWLRSSSLHCDRWRDTVDLSLGIDNTTRWSSWFNVIDNAMRKKSKINEFLMEYDHELEDCILNGSDWDLLGKTHTFLKPFAQATLSAEKATSSISQTLALMDALLLHYERAKKKYSSIDTRDQRMLHAIEMGWFVLDKYYTMTSDVPVYAAALLLHPGKRTAYIKKNWPVEWREPAIAAARKLWIDEYASVAIPGEADDPISSPSGPPEDELDELLAAAEPEQETGSMNMDNLDAFINTEPRKIGCKPLEWWCRSEQRSSYPRLSRMAIDILSIPPESADPERAFSGARRTASWDRLSMTCQNLERVECIGSWLREGLIVPASEGGRGLVYEPAAGDEDITIDPTLQDSWEVESMNI
jgi:hypothetical protein